MIPVFFNVNHDYTQHLCVTIASILCNSKAQFKFYIMHVSLTEADRGMIESMKIIRPFEVEYIDFNGLQEQIAPFNVDIEHITIDASYRLLMPYIKPELQKALYIDSDLVVCADLQEMWDIDVKDVCCAGASDYVDNITGKRGELYGSKFYFNSGVLVLNLERIRQRLKFDDFVEIARKYREYIYYTDQDVLNLAFSGNVTALPPRWNVTDNMVARILSKNITKDTQRNLLEAFSAPAICHYAGAMKPWVVPCGPHSSYYADVYFYYLRMTPYAGREAGIRAAYSRVKASLRLWARHPFQAFKKKFWLKRRMRRMARDFEQRHFQNK